MSKHVACHGWPMKKISEITLDKMPENSFQKNKIGIRKLFKASYLEFIKFRFSGTESLATQPKNLLKIFPTNMSLVGARKKILAIFLRGSHFLSK